MRTGQFPRLLAIIDADVAARAGWSAPDLARAYLDGGARFLQVRAKHLPSGAFLELCDEIVGLAGSGAAVIVNDRADLARLAGAAGVHLGQSDLPPVLAHQVRGARATDGQASTDTPWVVGLSTHSVAHVEAALREPVSYIAVGPVFGTSTKDTGYNAVGLSLVSAAAHMAEPMSIVGIGGIRLDSARSVVEAGASAVAVITDLLATGDPEARTKEYLRVLTWPP